MAGRLTEYDVIKEARRLLNVGDGSSLLDRIRHIVKVEQLARDLLARLSYDHGDGEDCQPEVESLFERGERLLPAVEADDVIARTRNTPPTPLDDDRLL